MKKQLTLMALACAGIIGATAANNPLRIYINPGHGGHESNDRNVVIEPYEQGDPNGYWESNSNLEKGLALRDMLQAKGYDVVMSRVTNTEDDDLGLSTIVNLANKSQADLFFSIHSNATGTSARRNFPLMLYRGYDNEPQNPEAKVVAGILNKHLLENQVTWWTSTTPNIRGDWSFYPSWGLSGLGVLRGLTITGMLSEGSFHDYIPEAYRLMNKEFCWLEAYHFRRAIDEYLKQDGEAVGHVFGRLNDSRLPRDGKYVKYGDDLLATVQGATVELYDAAGTLVQSYTTETINTNGVYGFRNVAPGTYTVKTKVASHYDAEQTVEVQADLVTYANFRLNKVRTTPPQVLDYSPFWEEGDEGVLCNSPVVFNFNWDMDVEKTAAAFKIEPAVEGTITWEDLNYRMIFTPTKAYETGTRYTVTLGTEAAHAGGTKMEKPLTFSFVTSDRNFMEIIGQSPREGDEVHYRNAAVEFRFDKRPDFGNLIGLVTCTDDEGKEVKFNPRGTTTSKVSLPYGYFRMTFLNDLVPGKTYTVHLSGDLADPDGLKIKEAVAVTFKAVDAGTEKEGTVVDDMTDKAAFTYNADQSISVKSQSVSLNSKTALFDRCLNFKYAFEGTEGGEVLWNTSAEEPVAVTSADVLTVHVEGDLSENSLYFLFSSDVTEKYVPVASLNYIGWRTFDVPLTALEEGQTYTFRGVKVVQEKALQNGSGTVGIDNIVLRASAGIEAPSASGLTLGPVPADQYLVANADYVITSVELIDMQGRTVAATAGNALYVGDIAAGNYIAVVGSASGRVARRVAVAH